MIRRDKKTKKDRKNIFVISIITRRDVKRPPRGVDRIITMIKNFRLMRLCGFDTR